MGNPYKNITEDQRQASRDKKDVLISEFIELNEGDRGRYLKTLPKVYKWLFYEVFMSKKSKAKAIKAKCLDCACFQKEEIRNCTCKLCPLWDFRPYK